MQSETNLLPLRGSSVHEIVENDHETIKGLLNSLTHSAAREDRMQTLEQLKGALTIHNAMEENLIYPALAKVAGHNFETMKLYNETASADMLVFEIDTILKEGDETKFAEKAEKLQAAVFKHIEAEEEKAMPHLQKGSDSAESQMLLQSVREFRGAIQFMPKNVAAAHA
ncbi:MAG TPA: hemerythrin domain-containing protein [Candidatus Baltobacteraceae bacterium]